MTTQVPNLTADGAPIVEGLIVWTNNYDKGRVTGRSPQGDYGRESDRWYDVEYIEAYTGEPKDGLGLFNGERLVVRDPRRA